MNAHSLLFADSSDRYQRFAKVLTRSMARHSPSVPLTVHKINGADHEVAKLKPSASRPYVSNTRKGKHWLRLVEEAPEGELLALLDLDLIVTGDLSPVEALPFDFAYTVRPHRYPFNTGAVFVRVSEATRQWFRDWYAAIEAIMRDAKLFRSAIDQFAGVHQAGLGALLARRHSLAIARLECRYWNCTVTELCQFDRETKLVHVLGNLRSACLGTNGGSSPIIRELAQRFHEFEKEA